MRDGKLKSRLRWLELALYAGGIALLAVFFHVRGESERMREEGLRAFEQIRSTEDALPAERSHGNGEREEGYWIPNQADWSDQRIRAYQESRAVQADPPLAVLSIDKLGIAVPVYNGTDEFNLTRGVGRIKGTAWIDGEGNLGIAGHRDGFFRPLKDIVMGDTIQIQTAKGLVRYTVSSITITDPSDVSVLSPSKEKTITLVTCYPFYYVGHAPKRYIVKATAEHSLEKT
jgi:sortase A